MSTQFDTLMGTERRPDSTSVGVGRGIASERTLPSHRTFQVRLFGRLRIEYLGRPITGLTGSKSQELLAYLMVHRDRAHRREALADRLWGDCAPSDLRKCLRQALWQLHSSLAGMPTLIESHGCDWIRIQPTCNLWLDVEVFESTWLEIEEVPGSELAVAESRRAQWVVDLCRDELLEGHDWEWCQFERERLRDLYMAMVDKLMSWCEAVGEHVTGIRLGFDLLRHDRAREQTYLRLMRLHALAGDRTGALHQYRRCVHALRDELAVGPGRAITELYTRIRDDRPIAEEQATETMVRRRGDISETLGV